MIKAKQLHFTMKGTLKRKKQMLQLFKVISGQLREEKERLLVTFKIQQKISIFLKVSERMKALQAQGHAVLKYLKDYLEAQRIRQSIDTGIAKEKIANKLIQIRIQ